MEKCIHWLFEEQVENQPDETALLFEDRATPYNELNRDSNRIAHSLMQQGLDAGQQVGIMLRDGPVPVTAMLGVLKAGGVIVYLDPSYPTQRLATILAEAKPAMLVTESDCLAEHADVIDGGGLDLSAVLFLDETDPSDEHRALAKAIVLAAEISAGSDENPERRATPDDAAYIVYTSGSTGKPKGIVQSHRSFCQYIGWQSDQFGVKAPERFAQWASFAYDACYREVFCTLGFGATLCLAPAAVRYTPKSLIEWMRANRVTIFNVVPSFWRQVVEILKSERRDAAEAPLPDLKVLLHPGEPMPVDLAATWLGFPNAARLFNLYGPSECILATFHEVKAIAPDQRSVPIGTPIGGREILILGEDLKPCAPGVEGEICVRSRFLTMGYYQRPEETAEKYIANPLTGDPEDRVYRTGDLGRLREDGLIEFAGRRDRMVKIRGQRVELGDIEFVLRSDDRISDCAVIVRNRQSGRESMVALERDAREGAGGGEQMLLAYYTTSGSASESELRKLLEKQLPAHMVPQRFVQLDAMPLNANRKLDVNALPEPDDVRPDMQEAFVAPRTDMEKAIAGVWQDVLGIDRVGVNDGFLELGGNSLLAMQVLNRIRAVVDVKFSFRDLFKEQTVGRLAALVDDAEEPAAPSTAAMAENKAEDSQTSFPLSKAQEGVWFLWNLDPTNPYYTGQGSIRIQGKLDLTALNKAWNALFVRHEILRVRFEQEGGLPRQRFVPVSEIELQATDLSHLTADARHEHLEDLARERAKNAFNLEEDDLLQYRLFKLADDEHVISITFHEIILDLWALTVLIRDLGTLYKHFVDLPDTQAPALEFRYRDYAMWESASVTHEKMETQRDYWREQLSGELPVLSLPTDRPYPKVPSYNGAAKSAFLSADISNRMRALAREHDATLFATLLSALNVMLRVYSGQDDIIVGAPIANRQHPQAEKLVGFFLNMLPLRTRFGDGDSFADVLRNTRETVTGALSHADYPFAWMLEQANFTRDLSTQPVFQVMFNMLNLPQATQDTGDVRLTYDEFDTGYIKYDLAFYAQEQGDRIYFQIAYLTDLFDADTVQRMLDNFMVVLENLAARPDAPLSEIHHITESEQHTLLVDFNQSARPYPMDRSIHQLFEQQAAATPDATALIFGDRTLTYRELNERANNLAHYLRRKGVEPEDRIAICVDRSFEMMQGLLGILKAGGSYVALDTEYPPLRQREILDASTAKFLLVTSANDVFETFEGTKIVLDDDRDAIAQESGNDPTPARTSDMLMNLVYTSSTTGKPKGVLIKETSVLNRLHWMWEDYPFQSGDVALLQKSYALVASTWELFGALLKGYPTVILSYDQLLDPAELWKQATKHGVTHLLAIPALLEGILLQAEATPGGWPTLRFATTSAEQIPMAMVNQWKQAFPDVPLLNLYGATECSSNATAFDTRELNDDALRVPVGKPIANVNVYVLDEQGRPLPLGATGEMCVSGACVANGYFDNPELNATQFIENRLSDQAGPVIYRTGDLARFRPDGNVELVGRRDNQVTVRGFRVELNDVESVIMRHPDVEKVAVVMDGAESRRRLVAYVAASEDVTASALRTYLMERLPGYMVPAEFVLLEQIPLTAQGKVDRKALSEMVREVADVSATYVAPTSATERQLADLWAQLLGVEKVGVHDNFFELGGHSLLAVQLFSELRKTTAMDLPLAALFRSPTITQLAELMDEDGDAPAWSSLVAIRPEGDKAPLFCVHGVYGDVLFYREFAENVAEGHPVYGLQPPTLSGGALPYATMRELAEHYVDMMRQVQPTGAYHICGYSFGGTASLEMARVLREQGESVAMLSIFDTLMGSEWADPVQHEENLGRTRSLTEDGAAATLRQKLRANYPIWRSYMILKGAYVAVLGRLHDMHVRRGNTLPREHRSAYTAWCLRRLSARYEPLPFDGEIVLFCSQKRKHKVVKTWSRMAQGGLKIFDVPGDHLFIFQSESVRFLAQEVSKRLEAPRYELAAE
jgi:surfactin family lipopeptide synthetase A